MSRHIDDVTGFVMTANFNVTSTALCPVPPPVDILFMSVCDCGMDGRVRQRSVTHSAGVCAAANKPNTDL